MFRSLILAIIISSWWMDSSDWKIDKRFRFNQQVRERIEEIQKWIRRHIMRNPARMLISSFVFLIAVGTGLLLLPQSSHRGLTVVDAFFTATSASCVTGLTVFEVSKELTYFGQIVVLLLIQIGGLGILTFSTLFILIVGGGISFRGQSVLQEAFGNQPLTDFNLLLKMIFVVTLAIEGVGALLLYVHFRQLYPPETASFFSIFHSVSAFCNAGFSLYSDSLIRFQSDWYVNLVFCGLIVCGGLGFVVYYDLGNWLFRRGQRPVSSLTFHTRLTLVVTSLLIAGGALVFFLLEYGNVLKNLDWPAKVWVSLFQSITPRTAGFNTVPYEILSSGALFFTIMLMYIGGSIGSCSGGIKTGTFTVLVALAWAKFRNQEEVNIMRRRIPENALSRAIAISMFATLVIIFFTFLLLESEVGQVSHQQSRNQFLQILFEVTSAFGTVGLSTGITSGLSSLGKIAIAIVMFLGRVGPLTVAVAVARTATKRYRYASETFLVG